MWPMVVPLALLMLSALPRSAGAEESPRRSVSYTELLEASAPPKLTPGIVWTDLACDAGDTRLLCASSGVARRGRVLAVIGPSGSGKTMLLGALSGMLPRGAGLHLQGRITDERGETVAIENGDVAVLSQTDSFFSELKVAEVLRFVMQLKNSRISGGNLDTTLASLGLLHLKRRRVGDRSASATSTGLSGGERRRLSVACELLAGGGAPRLLAADEPTTGLDTAGAEKVVLLLKELSRECDMPVICVLHQPSSRTWRLLDDVCLIAPGGRILYVGPTEEVGRYFGRLGYRLPPMTNPAEWLADLATISGDDEDQRKVDEKRVAWLSEAHRRQMAGLAKTHEAVLARRAGQRRGKARHEASTSAALASQVQAAGAVRRIRRPGLPRRVYLLAKRSFMQNIRSNLINAARMVASVGLAYLFRVQFGALPALDATSVADRVALLSFSAISIAQLSIMKTLDVFGREKAVVSRERQRGLYSGVEYLFAKIISELPMDVAFGILHAEALRRLCTPQIDRQMLVGCLGMTTLASATLGLAIGAAVPNGNLALAIGSPLMIVHMITGIINPSGAKVDGESPKLWRLARDLSPIRWAIEALCVNEFMDVKLQKVKLRKVPQMGGLALVRNGNEVLERLGLEQNRRLALEQLGRLSAAHLGVACITLMMNRPHHVVVKRRSKAAAALSRHEKRLALRGGKGIKRRRGRWFHRGSPQRPLLSVARS